MDKITAKLPQSSWGQRKLLKEAYEDEHKDDYIYKVISNAFQKQYPKDVENSKE